jgi:hypothetical protein
MSPALHEMFLTAAAAAFDRQAHLAALVGGLDWAIDVPAARLSFGDRHRWAVQFLGTEGHAAGTWRWAWAGPSALLKPGLAVALALRDSGGAPEFAAAELPLREADGHALATVAGTLCGANAYYRCPYDGGALFALVADTNFPECPDPPLRRVADVFPQALAALDLPDHRRAFMGHVCHRGLSAAADGDRVIVRAGGESLTATFDDLHRLARLEVAADAVPEENPEESWDQAQIRRLLRG